MSRRLCCLLATLLFGFVLITCNLTVAHAEKDQHQAQQEQDYEKWGRLAVEVIKDAYPQAELVDYQYIGREDISPTIEQQSFKLVLRQNGREFPITVKIQYEKETERVTSITFEQAQ
ncbi:hypothetical protein J2S00_000461 [Caldalkalibacillus uzonensis]|uniref:DUF3889 domain-containing protein n=1 Tax=Caldalkalibacillus uzonensis TaxID=353224 RepID=A0ABU0CMQ2_9BACI|nr:DUF3889 domain-containing protein [Caldalkalibacillus uzonensis]MDQ0337691.1 hypothetical protein [Caldalkalibacillus uzonensis]